jgi:hypothetical protein
LPKNKGKKKPALSGKTYKNYIAIINYQPERWMCGMIPAKRVWQGLEE